MRVIKNPTQPGFNHYLFESVAALVKQGCAKDPRMVDKLEEMLIPPFNYVLSQDVQVISCLSTCKPWSCLCLTFALDCEALPM